ncbi:MAG TPA: NAD-dependent succinate-semialdehyde dehydrogenase [Mycobacteriales bacterium]|nr:NAD-dependent succinate-semialdehyde dehydrogenase [Mycobacteriales bacterium]
MRSINPATGELIAEYDEHTDAEVDAILGRARTAYQGWRRTSLVDRAAALGRVAALLRKERDEHAALMTTEMGKPLDQARAEVDKCAWACDYYAQHGERLLAPTVVPTEAAESYVQYLPLGPVLAVMPWNFPYWQLFRAGAAILLAGNVVLLKHAENVTGCARAIVDLLAEAGLGEDVVQSLRLPGARTPALLADDRIAAATLTGSTRAGSTLAAAAGRAIKKCVLELGGSDPFIVLADADVPRAAEWATRARFQNTGQSCIAAKRLIVAEPVAEEFEAELVRRVEALTVGDPTLPGTDLGPLARADLRDTLAGQVRRTVEAGGVVLTGGVAVAEPGFYYTPTVVRVEAGSGAPMLVEETFGPAVAVLRVPDARTAIEVANDTPYGLSSNLWTRDLDRARRLAGELAAGSCFVNGMTASDLRLPFGGVKRSGYGRELGSFGPREFVNIQTVVIVAQ